LLYGSIRFTYSLQTISSPLPEQTAASFSRMLHFVHSAGLLNELASGPAEVTVVLALLHSALRTFQFTSAAFN
jgi:hypothetical protein